jgi:hypothetical protein
MTLINGLSRSKAVFIEGENDDDDTNSTPMTDEKKAPTTPEKKTDKKEEPTAKSAAPTPTPAELPRSTRTRRP